MGCRGIRSRRGRGQQVVTERHPVLDERLHHRAIPASVPSAQLVGGLLEVAVQQHGRPVVHHLRESRLGAGSTPRRGPRTGSYGRTATRAQTGAPPTPCRADSLAASARPTGRHRRPYRLPRARPPTNPRAPARSPRRGRSGLSRLRSRGERQRAIPRGDHPILDWAWCGPTGWHETANDVYRGGVPPRYTSLPLALIVATRRRPSTGPRLALRWPAL